MFQGTLIASDFDATFFEKGFISPRNITETERYMQNGGLFTLSTARPVDSIARFLPGFRINAPAILGNGAVIYDFSEDKVLDAAHMHGDIIRVVREAYDRFPTAGIELYTTTSMRLARPVTAISPEEQALRPQGEPVDVMRFDEPLTRIVFSGTREENERVAAYIETGWPGMFQDVRPFGRLYSVMAKGVSKGRALMKLRDMLGIRQDKLYAIGDNHNDVEMLGMAGVSVCPANAKDEIKALCDLVVCDCMEGALADLIHHIEEHNNRKEAGK